MLRTVLSYVEAFIEGHKNVLLCLGFGGQFAEVLKEANATTDTMRVRFAPAPTGNLHIGGARTALFNWLYARAKNGQFILRIEDTDRQRSKEEYLDEILQSLSWLGLNWDEIYFQSQRLDIYTKYAQKLVKEGKAYLQRTENREQRTEDKSKIKEAIIFKVQLNQTF